MLIALYFFIVYEVIPQVGAYAEALLEPIMTIVIALCGMIMLLGAVGIKVSNNLGSTVVSGLFRACGYIFRTIIQAIGWIIRQLVALIPRVFNGSRRFFRQAGANAVVSNLLAVLATVLVVVIII